MRKLILAMAAGLGFWAAVVPQFAAASEHVNCDNVPRAEWAKCVLDQAADQGSQ
jgi:hypothetical protein